MLRRIAAVAALGALLAGCSGLEAVTQADAALGLAGLAVGSSRDGAAERAAAAERGAKVPPACPAGTPAPNTKPDPNCPKH